VQTANDNELGLVELGGVGNERGIAPLSHIIDNRPDFGYHLIGTENI